MNNNMKKLMLFSLACVLFTMAHAQLADSIKAQFIRDWQRAKAYTKEYLENRVKELA